MTHVRNLFAALLLPLLLPLQLGRLALHYRMGRLRVARESGDRGAISIELALAVVLLVGIAVAIAALILNVATKAEDKVKSVTVNPT